MWALIYSATLMLMLCAKTFFSFWVLLELNLVLFIGVMQASLSGRVLGTMLTKYLLVQGLSSSLLILAHLLTAAGSKGEGLFSLGVVLKLGLVPFHEWVMSMNSVLSWPLFGLLNTGQKLGPLTASGYALMWEIYAMSILLSTIVATGLVGVRSKLRVVLGLSSVFNSAWVLALSGTSSVMMWLFFLYSYSFLGVTLLLSSVEGREPFSVVLDSPKSVTKLALSLSLLSLSGFPPLIGSFFKLSLMSTLLIQSQMAALAMFFGASTWFMLIYLWAIVSVFGKETLGATNTLMKPRGASGVVSLMMILPMALLI